MTATVPDVETIEHLDFEPACQLPTCEAGHPVATHQLILAGLPCGCDRVYPICPRCVAMIRWTYNQLGFSTICPSGHVIMGHPRHYGRIEPLP